LPGEVLTLPIEITGTGSAGWSALEDVFRDHGTRMKSIAYNFLGNEHDADAGLRSHPIRRLRRRALAAGRRRVARGHADECAHRLARGSRHRRGACEPRRDWRHIVTLYDALLILKPSPLIRLNRAVAMFRADRLGEALAELEALKKEEGLRGYSLLPATQARLHEEAGNISQAKRAYQRALGCAMSAPAREFLERRHALAGD